jgi:hypothetical protein
MRAKVEYRSTTVYLILLLVFILFRHASLKTSIMRDPQAIRQTKNASYRTFLQCYLAKNVTATE